VVSALRVQQVRLSLLIVIVALVTSVLGSESPLPDLHGNRPAQSPDVFVMLVEPKAHPSDTGAVDANGLRHRAAEYVGKILPWLADTTVTVMPEYPYFEWRHRYQGQGLFRVTIEVKTGHVTKVITRKSTGFNGLDRSGMEALQDWRWKPGKWKEVDILVTFTLTDNPPRSAVLLRPTN
jgi:TonB family protein